MRKTTFSILDGSRVTARVEGETILLLSDARALPLKLSPSDADRLAGALSQLAATARADRATVPRCADCGEPGERTGHQTCQYPQDHV